MTPKIEIACFNLESALVVANSEVDRIELCSNLELGGTTPDFEMAKIATQNISIPIFIMIRPRGGNFIYSNAEFEHMKKEISLFKSLNIAGFVFGILDENNSIDIVKNAELVELAYPLPCTFHRAFDKVQNYKIALERVIECGFKILLTSGKANTALEGIDVLKELVQLAANRIVIMPGGGIRSNNILQILDATKAHYFHSSAIINNKTLVNKNEINLLRELLETNRNV